MEEVLFDEKKFTIPQNLSGMMLDALQQYVPHLKSTLTDGNETPKEIMQRICAASLNEQKKNKATTKEKNTDIFELHDMVGSETVYMLADFTTVNNARKNIETLKLMMFWSSYTLTRIQKIFDETAGFLEETKDTDAEYILEDGCEDDESSRIYPTKAKLISFKDAALKEENYGTDLPRFFKGEERCTQLQNLEADLLTHSAHTKLIAATLLLVLALFLITTTIMTSIMTAGALSPTLMAGVAVSKVALLATASITGTAAVASGYTSIVFFKQHSRRMERAGKLRTETSNYRASHMKEGEYETLDPGTEGVENHSIQ